MQGGLVARKRALAAEQSGIRHRVDGMLVRQFIESLPFGLTGDQERAIEEIRRDLASPAPMHRLLQGDVGSGKTVVAVSTLLHAVQGGHQGALMAPTEVLAEQHATGVRALLGELRVPDPGNLFGDRPLRVELLTNRIAGAERKDVLAGLADGSVDIVIGTHALIQEAVAFHSLGAVVVDEQHRFGVEQRAALRDKSSGHVPDVLVMTATPIPRTAAMTVYGDLDVSVLDELPPGRTPVATKQVSGARGKTAAYKLVAERIAAGERAYIVCPKVEPSEDDEDSGSADWADATTTLDEAARALPGVRAASCTGGSTAASAIA